MYHPGRTAIHKLLRGQCSQASPKICVVNNEEHSSSCALLGEGQSSSYILNIYIKDKYLTTVIVFFLNSITLHLQHVIFIFFKVSLTTRWKIYLLYRQWSQQLLLRFLVCYKFFSLKVVSQFKCFSKEEWNRGKSYIEQWSISRSFRTGAFSHQEDITQVRNRW